MKLVAIESPYAGDVDSNVEFCENVCRYAVYIGYSPYASHLIFTRFLDDDDPIERKLGIESGLAWTRLAEEAWMCLRPDEELSKGMQLALTRHRREHKKIRLMRFTQDGEFLSAEELI